MALPSPTVAPVLLGEIRRGKQSYIWVPTVASITSPTSAEITAGTDYKNQIGGDPSGFAPTGSSVDFGNAGSRLIGNVPGTITMGTGEMTFNLSKVVATADARATFTDGSDGVSTQTTGYWYFLPEGIVTSAKMRGFACTVISATESVGLDAAKQLTVMYSIQQATGFIAVPVV